VCSNSHNSKYFANSHITLSWWFEHSVQLFAIAGNGWPHNVPQYHQLMPISCHFRDCKALLVCSSKQVPSPLVYLLSIYNTVNTIISTVRKWQSITHHCLKRGMQRNQEWRLVAQSQYTFLHHDTINIIILNDDFLLQNFNSIQLISTFALNQQHLSANQMVLTSFQYFISFRVFQVLTRKCALNTRHRVLSAPPHSAFHSIFFIKPHPWTFDLLSSHPKIWRIHRVPGCINTVRLVKIPFSRYRVNNLWDACNACKVGCMNRQET